MNSQMKDLLDDLKKNFEYNEQYRQLLSDIVDYIVYKKKSDTLSLLNEKTNFLNGSAFGKEEIEYVKESLVEIINTANSDELAGSAIETLSLFGDPQHIPMFRQKLELYLKRFIRANHPFTASIHALSNCCEEIKSGHSFGITEVEKNIQLAREYLTKLNKSVPW